MGLLTFFSKPAPTLVRLPSGSFSVNRDGEVIASTLPQSFPRELVSDITDAVLKTFRNAQQAQLPLSEVIVNFPALRITARSLRGGALIFLFPREMSVKSN